MKFSEVVGQRDAIQRLLRQTEAGRVAHAQLICGPEGCGKFAIALAYASYLLCERPAGGDSCGHCPGCVKTRRLEHPDLHFIFPTIKKQTCKSLYAQWREMVAASPYFTLDTWLAAMKAEREQPTIYAAETDTIRQDLMLHSSEGGRKVVIVWLPERMNETGSNKMLKLYEEPPEGTVFLLVSEQPEQLLPTVVSRMQRFDVPPIAAADLEQTLTTRHGIEAETAKRIARQTRGNYAEALATIQANLDEKLYFDEFVLLMRRAWARDIKSLLEWSTEIAHWNRERQKSFMAYSLRLVRENFMRNFRLPELSYMNDEEAAFASRFARFINERNVIPIAREMERCAAGIPQNANAEIAMFDFAMKMIILIHR